ncbi:MAG: phenylalanine--tRNA ligase subunit alpha [bacterium]
MIDIIEKIRKEFDDEIQVIDTSSLEFIKTKYIGRKSQLNEILRSLKDATIEERKIVGSKANELQKHIEQAILEKENQFSSVTGDALDVTSPGRTYPLGHVHPVNQVVTELVGIFKNLGYEVAEGPEIEDEWHNFEALNMPNNHPARDMQDTFYLKNGAIPRTQTSSVQIRYMEDNKPPIKIISPGKVHRNENEDATHSWVFHQLEGLVIDEGVTFADLKGTLELVAKKIFGPDTKTRFRPNFFPYTEPSAEMDASCPQCNGRGCRSCGGTGWLELLGAGMVHPQVLRNMGIDPEKYSGFAFGLGIDRIAMIKHQIPDARLFWHPDVRFLEQF